MEILKTKTVQKGPDKKVETKESKKDVFIFRKVVTEADTTYTCQYPPSQGGGEVPENLVPIRSFDADIALQGNGIAVVNKNGELYPNREEAMK